MSLKPNIEMDKLAIFFTKYADVTNTFGAWQRSPFRKK